LCNKNSAAKIILFLKKSEKYNFFWKIFSRQISSAYAGGWGEVGLIGIETRFFAHIEIFFPSFDC
jgi:hypothetical protein